MSATNRPVGFVPVLLVPSGRAGLFLQDHPVWLKRTGHSAAWVTRFMAAALGLASAISLANCSGSSKQARRASLKAEQAELKADQAEAAANRARAAAQQAEIAADRAQK